MVLDTTESETRAPFDIKRKDIPELLSPAHVGLFLEWEKSKVYGLPYGPGWAKQPCIAMDIIYQLDKEESLIRSHRRTNGQ